MNINSNNITLKFSSWKRSSLRSQINSIS